MKRPLWSGVIVTRDVSGLYGRFEAWVTYRRRDGQTVCEPVWSRVSREACGRAARALAEEPHARHVLARPDGRLAHCSGLSFPATSTSSSRELR
jgi:hypothetical protein